MGVMKRLLLMSPTLSKSRDLNNTRTPAFQVLGRKLHPLTASTVHPEAQVPVTPKKKQEAPAKDPVADVWAFFQTCREVGADPHIQCKICL